MQAATPLGSREARRLLVGCLIGCSGAGGAACWRLQWRQRRHRCEQLEGLCARWHSRCRRSIVWGRRWRCAEEVRVDVERIWRPSARRRKLHWSLSLDRRRGPRRLSGHHGPDRHRARAHLLRGLRLGRQRRGHGGAASRPRQLVERCGQNLASRLRRPLHLGHLGRSRGRLGRARWCCRCGPSGDACRVLLLGLGSEQAARALRDEGR
mmetsp:Transcript_71538/g.232500  ORF Transcript_71538/g.232500 Transcript_71538/m.232500 type:complete len:209 (+) Transcript_71538:5024-5650(+)